MNKESSKIYTGTFYIVDDKIVYTLDTSEEDAIDHYQLWDLVVPKLFPHVPYDVRKELKMDAVYGAERGRVVFKGERSSTGAYRSGTFSIYGTPGAKKHLRTLKRIFGLTKIEKLDQYNLEEDFESDPHYKVKPSDKRLLDEIINSSKSQFKEKPDLIRIAGWKKVSPDPERVLIAATK